MNVLLLEYQNTRLAVDLLRVRRLVRREDIAPLDPRLLFPSTGGATYVQLENDRLLPVTRVIDIRECPPTQAVPPLLARALKTNPFAGFFACDAKVFGLLGAEFLAQKE